MPGERKKSFILYYDIEEQTQSLSNEQLGCLFRAILAYEKRDEKIEINDPFVKMAFEFISVQLREAKLKYTERCLKNAENGRKGGRPENPFKETE